MKLKYQEELDKLENCPSTTLKGNIKLFRWINKENYATSFIPLGNRFNGKLEEKCLAWGLSTHNNIEVSKEVLNNLPQGFKKKFNGIATCVISDEDGVKHQSGNCINHFTFYPNQNFDYSSKFQILDDEN